LQIGYAESGDTLAKVASVFNCQNPGSYSQSYIVTQLMNLNPQINSPDLPLVRGDQICVAI
jgi:hypothetical protein